MLQPLLDRFELSTSIVVFGELHEGFPGTGDPSRAAARYVAFLAGVHVYDIDRGVALTCASVRSDLRRIGQLMSDNDLWIAATALHYDLTLVSRDKAFDRIPNLKLLR